MGYIDEFVALGIIALLGAISPGPDFAIVIQNALRYGKKAGIATSLGIAIGCLVHISYCVLGIGVLISESVFLFNLLRYTGAAYLIYLGAKGLLQKQSAAGEKILAQEYHPHHTTTFAAAFKNGLAVNLLNPKVTLFILSVFTQVISPTTPRLLQSLMGIEFATIAFIWFTFLTWVLTHPLLKQKLIKAQSPIERILGVFLILLGLKVAIL